MRKLVCFLLAAPLFAAPAVEFQRDIRLILAKKCFACHGPDQKSRQANLRLDTFEGATGKSGGSAAIVPGDSSKSRMIARVVDPKRPMPPVGEPLAPREVQLLRDWIDQGASYKQHWAFEKPLRLEPPPVRNTSWPRNPIDRFVLAKLESEGLQPSPEADSATLARRVALDLTGIPPEPSQLALNYDALVDALLASPRYGERWARVWLDLARYADTQGYEKDNRRTIWPYRDWVINAYNRNLPFDRFTILQIAGDLLPNATDEDVIATGFHRNTMTNTEGGTDDEEFRDAAVKDRVAVTGQVWMGLTWGCAQCHSHKYDPFSNQEFYQIYAFYNQTEDADKPDDRPTLNFAGVATPVMRELTGDRRRVTRIHERGNFLNPGAEVSPRTPEAFHAMPGGAPPNRLGLAQWLVDRDNPLTARVQVNRLWARLFGRGIVESEEDFGTQGSSPSHPELLDWLATEYIRLNWDTKALLKTIVASATYRQSSHVTPHLQDKDPYNRLLARGARFRLDAEVVRDQALAVSGLLSSRVGGPSVMPWQPDGIWQVVYNGERWQTSKGEDRYRRGLYTFNRRTSPYPSMIAFDAPTGETCTIRRVRTNTPLQALATLNDPVQVESSQQLALRTLRDAPKKDAARAAHMFRLVTARTPSRDELQRILELHRTSAAELKRGAPLKLLHFDRELYIEDREVPLVATASPEWHFTTDDPGPDWLEDRFDDSRWRIGQAPFGYFEKNEGDNRTNTDWQSERIWLRVSFQVADPSLERLRLSIRNAGSFEAFLNGAPAASTNLDRAGYYDYTPAREAVLKPGRNVLAIQATRIREKNLGQIIDAGLIGVRPLLVSKSRDDSSKAAWVVVANALLNLDETLTRR